MARNTKLVLLSSLLLSAGGLAGCDIDIEIGESETAADSMGSGVGMDSGDSMDPSETTDPSDSGVGMDSGDSMDPSDSGDTMGPDVGGSSECDPLLQDCPDGEGCDLWGDIYICAPEGGQGEGDDCNAMQPCVAGLHCSADGVCEPMCDPNDPGACMGGTCIPLDGAGLAGTCEPDPAGGDPCDPLLQDCDDGEACYPLPDEAGFICLPEGMGDQGDDCEYIDACYAGLMCVDGTVLPGTPNPGGCTAFCDLSDPMGFCGEGMECVPYFEGMAPPGYENIGLCLLGM